MTQTTIRSTTILLVRREGQVCLAGDGQVTANDTVLKGSARKVLRTSDERALVGFAGGAADGLALFARFENKLQEFQGNLERASVELAKDWRTDRALRQLQAQMIVTGANHSFLSLRQRRPDSARRGRSDGYRFRLGGGARGGQGAGQAQRSLGA